jgi:hypothetical protein
MQSASPNKKRHEVWNWFIDEETQTGKKAGKHRKQRVYCLSCLDVHLQALRESDEQSEIEHTDTVHSEQCKQPKKYNPCRLY